MKLKLLYEFFIHANTHISFNAYQETTGYEASLEIPHWLLLFLLILIQPFSPQFGPHEFLIIQQSLPPSEPQPTARTAWFRSFPHLSLSKIPLLYSPILSASMATAIGPMAAKKRKKIKILPSSCDVLKEKAKRRDSQVYLFFQGIRFQKLLADDIFFCFSRYSEFTSYTC